MRNLSPKMKQMIIGDVERNVVEVPFSVVQEDWAEYEIPDGKVRVRMIVQRIKEVVDEEGNPVRLENGDRHIIVEWAVHVTSLDEESA